MFWVQKKNRWENKLEFLYVHDKTLYCLVSFLCWGVTYLWSTIVWKNEVPEFYSRVISLIHGLVAGVVGCIQCDIRNFKPCRLNAPVTKGMYALMIWSWGYFAFDTLWCLLYWPHNIVMNCHHMSAVGCITLYLNKQNTGCVFPCALALMEINNPLLQIRWFLKNQRKDKMKIFTIIELVYLISFIFLRGVLGTFIILKVMFSNIVDRQGKFASLLLYSISMALILEILGYVLYKYRYHIDEFKDILDEMGIILNEQF